MTQNRITGNTASASYEQCQQDNEVLDQFLSSIGVTDWFVQPSADPNDPTNSKFNLIAYPANSSTPYSEQDYEQNAAALQQILVGDPDQQWLLSSSYSDERGYDIVLSRAPLAATNFDPDAASEVLDGVENDPDNPGAKGISQYNPATDSYDLYVNAPADPEYS